jgi:three-Cys-motif partner protein
MSNEFGGNWTQEKINVFMKYVPAYLKIMNSQIKNQQYAKEWKLMYFDGFAGSGEILHESSQTLTEGVATRVLAITEPREFDIYRFVELNKTKVEELKNAINAKFSERMHKVVIYQDDFNEICSKMVSFLRKDKKYKTLAFVDPFGMEVNWSSIENMKDLSLDMWILVPTGGMNRLLKNNGDIEEAWLSRLQKFLGLSEEEIKKVFYTEEKVLTLFGERTHIQKQEDAIEKAHSLYKSRLETVFKYVSGSYVMRNSNNTILYHFLLVSNNQTAVKIANSIVGNSISKL